MKPEFIVCTPPYYEKSGGIIVLHKLCHLINQLGFKCTLTPCYNSFTRDPKRLPKIRNINLKWLASDFLIKSRLLKLKTNPKFEGQVFYTKNNISSNSIVIYPEIVHGNPLGSANTVRWLLHRPGFHTGEIGYGNRELYFKYDTAIEYEAPTSKIADTELRITHFPLETYKKVNHEPRPIEVAYSVRKGKFTQTAIDLTNAKNIDGLSHKRVAEILNHAKYFVSFDNYSAYSKFAVLCGAISIVVPEAGRTIDQWYPNPDDRHGVAYGFDKQEIERSINSSNELMQRILSAENENTENTRKFIHECRQYFDL